MDKVLNDDTPLRSYLLGELTPDEELQVEERLIVDNDYIELLEVVEDELIDSYARGEIEPHKRENFERQFFVTPERISKLRLALILINFARWRARRHARETVKQLHPAGSPDRLRQILSRTLPHSILSTVLIALMAGIGFLIYSQWGDQFDRAKRADMEAGLRALNDAYSQQRPLRSRLTALDHAPFADNRGNEKIALIGPGRVALDRAARIFLDLVSEDPIPASYHAAGRYYLTQKEYDQAIYQFDSALESDRAKSQLPDNQKARLESDYAVALMERARSIKAKDPVKYRLGLAESREHLSKALKLDGESPEALFNLGLLQQENGLWRQAEEAWNRYLQRDSSSPWADEARTYRSRAVEQRKRQVSLSPQQVLQDFLAAYRAGDKKQAWNVISHNREAITGKLIWWQLSGAFLDAANNNRNDQAGDLLRAFSYAGEMESEKGDHFTGELAAFYRSSSPQQRRLLARAHALTNEGHALCLKSKYTEAFDRYDRAKALFRQAGDSWEASFTEYWIGYCYDRMAQPRSSLLLLDRLSQVCWKKRYLSLLVQTLSTSGTCYFDLTEYQKSSGLTRRALEIAREIDDSYGMQKNLGQLAYFHRYLDDLKQALSFLHQGSELAQKRWPGSRQMWRTYDTIAQVLGLLHFYTSAADYQEETLWLAENEFKDPSHLSVSYAQLASIYMKLHRNEQAIKSALNGLEASQSAGRRMMAYSLLCLGHLYRENTDYERALSYYKETVELCREMDNQVWIYIYNAYIGRILCYLAQGKNEAAESDIDIVLGLAEKYRANIIKEKRQNTFFDAEQSIYDIAIDFEYLRKGNSRTAFEYSEISHARSLLDLISAGGGLPARKKRSSTFLSSVIQPFKLEKIREQMPEQTQVLQYAVLNDRLFIWVISKKRFDIIEKKIGLRELHERTLDYWRSVSRIAQSEESKERVRQQARGLYEILISPAESKGLLDREKTICVVPDKAINYLPFNALISPASGKYLIDEYQLTFAPSSTVFLICSEWARQRGKADERLLSVGNPSFDREDYSELLDSEGEARRVADYYRDRKVLIGTDAREAVIKPVLNRFDVVHLASHYIVDDHSPMLSKLLLAKGSDGSDKEDGMLHGEEIYLKSPLPARLVILSTCQSGIERYYNGEGMIGMARTFIASGVPLVVASLWPVDSEATAELMVNFHRYRKQEGCSTAEALRLAQLEMSRSSRRFNQPRYWASFVVIGGHANF